LDMTGHSWIGVAVVLGAIGLLIAAAAAAWTPFFALLVVVVLVMLSPVFFGARRAAGVDPERTSHDEVGNASQEPSDASPRAPHGYTPST